MRQDARVIKLSSVNVRTSCGEVDYGQLTAAVDLGGDRLGTEFVVEGKQGSRFLWIDAPVSVWGRRLINARYR